MPRHEITIVYDTETHSLDVRTSGGIPILMALGILDQAAHRIRIHGDRAVAAQTPPAPSSGLALLGSLAAALAGGAAKPPG